MTSTSEKYKAVLGYVRHFGTLSGRPGRIDGLDGSAAEAKFIQIMREQGFVDETEEDLMSTFQQAKRAVIDEYNDRF